MKKAFDLLGKVTTLYSDDLSAATVEAGKIIREAGYTVTPDSPVLVRPPDNPKYCRPWREVRSVEWLDSGGGENVPKYRILILSEKFYLGEGE